MLAQVLLTEQRLQALFDPLGRARRQPLEEFLAEGSLLRNVLEQFLVVHLPAELAADAPADAAAACSRFAADGRGQRRRALTRSAHRGAIALKTMARRFAHFLRGDGRVFTDGSQRSHLVHSFHSTVTYSLRANHHMPRKSKATLTPISTQTAVVPSTGK